MCTQVPEKLLSGAPLLLLHAAHKASVHLVCDLARVVVRAQAEASPSVTLYFCEVVVAHRDVVTHI